MWVLILTLITMKGDAMVAVPGFFSEKACENAATAWRQQQSSARDYTYLDARTVCVKLSI